MGKVIKWFGIVLGSLVGLLLIALAALNIMTSARMAKTYTVPEWQGVVPTRAEAIEHGSHLATIHCKSCHGPDLGGSIVFNDPMLATIVAPNITGGYGLSGRALTDSELNQAIRHGVNTDGKLLLVMPSAAFYYLSDQDLVDLIAYLRSLPTLTAQSERTSMTLIGKALAGAGAFGKITNAEDIDHTGPRPAVVAPGRTAAYGEYMARSSGCDHCHGTDYSGGKSPNPESPPAPALTRAGNLATWSEADFNKAMRTGTTPDGRHLSPFMAWQYYGQMTDDELAAVYQYLQGIPVQTASN